MDDGCTEHGKHERALLVCRCGGRLPRGLQRRRSPGRATGPATSRSSSRPSNRASSAGILSRSARTTSGQGLILPGHNNEIATMDKTLPKYFAGDVFSIVSTTNQLCYAFEHTTGLHFYVSSRELHEEISTIEERNSKERIPIVIRRKRRVFGYDYLVHRYDNGRPGECVGMFEGPCGAGPQPVSYTHLTLPTIYSV